jgi:hypothetical protein
LFKSQAWALLGSLAFALWLPFFYFSPILSAESLSMFFVAALCYQMARHDQASSRLHVLSMVVLAVLVYLKPNHALLFLPFAAVLEYRRGGGGKGVTILGPLFVLVVLMLPWTIWVSTKNGMVIPLSATSGYNMYIGTGVTFDEDGAANDLPAGSAATNKLGDPALNMVVGEETQGMTAAQQNRYLQKTALGIWLKRPGGTISYGVAKTLHAFGFSFRHARDSLLVVQFVTSLLFSLYLWKRRRYREWCVFFWGVVLVAAFQAFVFLPDQRLKTVVFDFPAIIIAVLGVVELIRRSPEEPQPHKK